MKKIKSDESLQNFKNPLMQALGIVVQRMRNVLVLSSDEAAARLGLGGSSYRMVEAGSAVLQPGKALHAVRLFDRMEFEPLSRILVAIQVMESGSESVDDIVSSAKWLSEADPELAALLRRFESVWPLLKQEDSDAIADHIREKRIDIDLERFLTTPRPNITDSTTLLETHVQSLVAKTPPFYIDLALDLLENLQGYVPRVTPDELAKWEEKNKSRIIGIVGVVRDERSFTDIRNFKMFDYRFLWQDHFDRLRVLYLNRNKKDVLRDFTGNLKRHIESNDLKSEHRLSKFSDVSKKIEIRWAYSKLSALDELLRHESRDMNNLWFYSLRGGNVVAFADNSSDDTSQTYYGTSFSFAETTRKHQTIEQIWSETAP